MKKSLLCNIKARVLVQNAGQAPHGQGSERCYQQGPRQIQILSFRVPFFGDYQRNVSFRSASFPERRQQQEQQYPPNEIYFHTTMILLFVFHALPGWSPDNYYTVKVEI